MMRSAVAWEDVRQAAFSPDGRRVVTASSNREAWIWDALTGGKQVALEGHKGWVEPAEFSPDGQWVVTASADRQMRIWDAELLILPHLDEAADPVAVLSAAFSPDGQRIVTVPKRGAVRLWWCRSFDHLDDLLTFAKERAHRDRRTSYLARKEDAR
jgi:WD40 repeat protein